VDAAPDPRRDLGALTDGWTPTADGDKLLISSAMVAAVGLTTLLLSDARVTWSQHITVSRRRRTDRG